MSCIVCFTHIDELAPYADDWERLAGGVPFRSWTWLGNWWRHYGPHNEAEALRTRLAVLGVFDDANSLMGIAPWYLECSAVHGRVLRPLGSGEVCSDYLGLLCHPATEEAVVEALADYLVENALRDDPAAFRWDLLKLDGVDAEDRTVADFVNSLAVSGCTVDRRPGLNCWRLELPLDWDSYVASLGRNLRRELRRLERELLSTDRVALHWVTRLDELPQAMDILVELHQRRRAMLGEAGCFASARFLGFYRDVVPELLRRGQVQFYWLELDGRPVAAEYQLVGRRHAVCLSGGRGSRVDGASAGQADQPGDFAAGDRARLSGLRFPPRRRALQGPLRRPAAAERGVPRRAPPHRRPVAP